MREELHGVFVQPERTPAARNCLLVPNRRQVQGKQRNAVAWRISEYHVVDSMGIYLSFTAPETSTMSAVQKIDVHFSSRASLLHDRLTCLA